MASNLQITRYDRLIRRATGIVGEGSIVTSVLPDVFPIVDLENSPLEIRTLGGWMPTFTALNTGPTVAVGQRHQIFNPVDSGILMVIEKVWLMVGIAQMINFSTTVVELTTFQQNVRPRDTRFGTSVRGVGRANTQEGGAPAATAGRIVLEPDISFPLDLENGLIVLGPGSGFEFNQTVVNDIFRTSWFGRERPADTAELNF